MDAINELKAQVEKLEEKTTRIHSRINEIKEDIYIIGKTVDTRVFNSILLAYKNEVPDSISILINAYMDETGLYKQSNSSRPSWRFIIDTENDEVRFERCNAGTSPVVWVVVITLSAGGVWS